MLSPKDFINIIEKTPLVSIDLIIRDEDHVLLGKRSNAPAKNYWFVPGGRIFKNEKWKDALSRIANDELNISISHENTKIIDIFDHIYKDNFLEQTGVNTHYIVIALEVFVNKDEIGRIDGDGQHQSFEWMSFQEILTNDNVHPYTKQHIKSIKSIF